jgi:uncharacterized protein
MPQAYRPRNTSDTEDIRQYNVHDESERLIRVNSKGQQHDLGVHMKCFFYKLIPPRPTFPQDMTLAEAKLMQDHAAYWKGLMDRGLVIAFGPVAGPKGAYGIAIAELDDNADPDAVATKDPTLGAQVGFTFEVYPRPQVVSRK